jgi:hypothetical protein
MEQKTSFWQKIGLQDWFLTNDKNQKPIKIAKLTPNEVYKYIVERFAESISQLSFGNRIVFYHEFIVIFNTEDYNEFLINRQGILGIIVKECVDDFYDILKKHAAEGKKVEPSASKWVFRLVTHPDYSPGDKGFIGKLLPEGALKEENLRVTFIPRQTGLAQTFDVSQDILKDFTYYSEGYYELPYALETDENKKAKAEQKPLARLTVIIPEKQFIGRNVEYLMKDEDIYVSGKDETREGSDIFRIPSDWVNTPHLHIRYNHADSKFYLASFGEKTILNEKEVVRSDVNSAQWVELPVNSKILLNGIIGINIFKP